MLSQRHELKRLPPYRATRCDRRVVANLISLDSHLHCNPTTKLDTLMQISIVITMLYTQKWHDVDTGISIPSLPSSLRLQKWSVSKPPCEGCHLLHLFQYLKRHCSWSNLLVGQLAKTQVEVRQCGPRWNAGNRAFQKGVRWFQVSTIFSLMKEIRTTMENI